MVKIFRPSILQIMGFNSQGDLGPWTFYTSKRRGLVYFVKSPPLEPPSFAQISQRNRMRMAGGSWSHLTPAQREQWEAAAKGAGLKITGYNLYVHWVMIRDDETLKTVSRQSGIGLPA